MIDKIIEILKKNVVSFNDHDVIFGGDGDLIDLANELEEAINYSQCCKSDRELFYCNNEHNFIEPCKNMCDTCKDLQD